MPPKKKGKAKSKKAPAYQTSPELLEPFGFTVGEPMDTPLCLTATVLGIKATDGRMWVQYESGMEAPLEPSALDVPLIELGYGRMSPMFLVQRELAALRKDVDRWHERQAALKLAELEKASGGKGKTSTGSKSKK